MRALERLLHGIQTSRLSNDVAEILRSYFAANLGYTKWKGSVIKLVGIWFAQRT